MRVLVVLLCLASSALAAEPADPTALLISAESHELEGRLDAAAADLVRYLEHVGNEADRERIERRIKSLQARADAAAYAAAEAALDAEVRSLRDAPTQRSETVQMASSTAIGLGIATVGASGALYALAEANRVDGGKCTPLTCSRHPDDYFAQAAAQTRSAHISLGVGLGVATAGSFVLGLHNRRLRAAPVVSDQPGVMLSGEF